MDDAQDGGSQPSHYMSWVAVFCAAAAAAVGVTLVARNWSWIEHRVLRRKRPLSLPRGSLRNDSPAVTTTPGSETRSSTPSRSTYAKLLYIPHDEIVAAGVRFIVVDGTSNPLGDAEVANLTHAPGAKLPTQLRCDTSTEIAFVCQVKEKHRVEWVRDASHVTIDHVDIDGLMALFVFVAPEVAVAYRSLIEKVAHAGDFVRIKPAPALERDTPATVAETTAAIKCWLTFESLLASAELNALTAGDKVRRMLHEIPNVLKAPNKYASHWQSEYEILQRSERQIEAGAIEIRDKPELDLMLVLVRRAAFEGTTGTEAALTERLGFRFAVYSRTKCFCALVSVEMPENGATAGGAWRHGLTYRYESYVNYMTALPHCRRDLTRLVARLNEAERVAGGGDRVWRYNKFFYLAYIDMSSSQSVSALSPNAVRTIAKAFFRSEDSNE